MPLSLNPADTPDAESSTSGEGSLTLPSRLDSRYAEELRGLLIAERGKVLTIEASDVEFLGAQAAGLLVSAAKTWSKDGLTLKINQPSETFVSDLGLLGMQPADISVE